MGSISKPHETPRSRLHIDRKSDIISPYIDKKSDILSPYIDKKSDILSPYIDRKSDKVRDSMIKIKTKIISNPTPHVYRRVDFNAL